MQKKTWQWYFQGAGGSRTRPDFVGIKPRSISNAASPTHSRTPSNASDTALHTHRTAHLIQDPSEFVEQLKGE